jgi:hypothetical protein
MSIEERIKYAEDKRDDAVSNGTLNDIVYWNGYLDGLKAVKRDNA